MKRYMLIAFIISGWQGGFCQAKSQGANQVVGFSRDTVKVKTAYAYDGLNCVLSKIDDKNGKPLVFSYGNGAISKKQIKKSK